MEIDKKDLDSILAEEKRRKLEESYTVSSYFFGVDYWRGYISPKGYRGYSTYSMSTNSDVGDYIINEWVGNKLIISFRKKYEELIKEEFIEKFLKSVAIKIEGKKWISMSDGSFINIEDFSVEFCFLDDECFTLPEPPSKYEKFKEKMSSRYGLVSWKDYYGAFVIFIFIGFPFSWMFLGYWGDSVFFWFSNIILFGFLWFLDSAFDYDGYGFFLLVTIFYFLLAYGFI